MRRIAIFRHGPKPDTWYIVADGSRELAKAIGLKHHHVRRDWRFHYGMLQPVIQCCIRAGVEVVFPAMPPLE